MAKLRTYDLEDSEPWNMNKAYLMRLDRRLDDRDVASSEGDLIKWYRTVRTIYSNIHWKIKQDGNEEQEQELINQIDKAKNLTKALILKKAQEEARLQLENLLHDLDIILNDLVVEYELIKLEKDKRDPNKAILEKFK